MGLIAALALATWLVIPAVRIWRDPKPRTHRHVLSGPDPTRRLVMVSRSLAPSETTRLKARVFAAEHPVSFWPAYRALLLESHPRQPMECVKWAKLRERIRPEVDPDARIFDQDIEADHVSIAR